MTIFTSAVNASVILTLKRWPRLTFFLDLTFSIGLPNPVVKLLSPPLVVPSGLDATILKWYVVQGVSPVTFDDTFCVAGTLQYGLGLVTPGGHDPMVPGGVLFPYAVVVP